MAKTKKTTKTVKIAGYIVHSPGSANEFRFSMYKPSIEYSPQDTIVQEHSFTVEVPADYDPRQNMVKNLEEKKEKARADFAALVVEIDRKINQLLALEA